MNRISFLATLALLLSACGPTPRTTDVYSTEPDGPPGGTLDPASIQDAVPKVEPRSAYGNPAHYSVRSKRYHVLASSDGYRKRGIASWYGTKFHGRRTSSGEPYDLHSMTAAHKTLPLPTYVEVTNLDNGRHAIVKVNDRGPFVDNRLIDLSYAAAVKLGVTAKGTALVEVRALNPAAPADDHDTSTPVRPSHHRLFIQVGAFANRDNALSLRNRLQGTRIPNIALSTTENRTPPLYRVRVGPLSNVEEADHVSKILTNLGADQQQIVVE